MARSAPETARILADLYDDSFGGDESEQYRLGWSELRGIAGVRRLDEDFLRGINDALLENGYLLVSCDNFLVVTYEQKFSGTRRLPQRLVEKYIYEEDENSEDADDFELEDEDDEEDELM